MNIMIIQIIVLVLCLGSFGVTLYYYLQTKKIYDDLNDSMINDPTDWVEVAEPVGAIVVHDLIDEEDRNCTNCMYSHNTPDKYPCNKCVMLSCWMQK